MIILSKNCTGSNAIPTSSLTTMRRSPLLNPNLSRAAFGITIWPRSPMVTAPQIFLPGGGGGSAVGPSPLPSPIRLSSVMPYSLARDAALSISGVVVPFSHLEYAWRDIPISFAICSCEKPCIFLSIIRLSFSICYLTDRWSRTSCRTYGMINTSVPRRRPHRRSEGPTAVLCRRTRRR